MSYIHRHIYELIFCVCLLTFARATDSGPSVVGGVNAGSPTAGVAPVGPTGSVVQIDVSELLDVRPVTTLTQGKLVPWNFGVDASDAYLTMAASLSVGDKEPKALSDDPLIPGDGARPEILLHYSNGDGANNQATNVADQPLVIPFPEKKYRAAFLVVTSSMGKSPVTITLQYVDGASVSKSFTVPDYYKDLAPNDPEFCYVVSDLAKWDKDGKMREKKHHNIDALILAPDPSRTLTRITLTKGPGKSRLLFWAATGVAAGI
jgi:hypothetical protein